MYREHLRRVLGHLKRALRMEHRLTVEEFNQLVQLSEAIIDYGRMIQAHYPCSVSGVIVEICFFQGCMAILLVLRHWLVNRPPTAALASKSCGSARLRMNSMPDAPGLISMRRPTPEDSPLTF